MLSSKAELSKKTWRFCTHSSRGQQNPQKQKAFLSKRNTQLFATLTSTHTTTHPFIARAECWNAGILLCQTHCFLLVFCSSCFSTQRNAKIAWVVNNTERTKQCVHSADCRDLPSLASGLEFLINAENLAKISIPAV